MVDKRRTGKNIAKAMNVVGNVTGKKCIIVDDMIDTAGTLIEAVMALKAEGSYRGSCLCNSSNFVRPCV